MAAEKQKDTQLLEARDASAGEKRERRIDFIVTIVYAAIILGLVYLAFKAVSVFLPFVLALILVAALNPLVRKIDKVVKFSKPTVSVIIIALLYVVAGLAIFGLVTWLVLSMKDVFVDLPAYYNEVIKPAFERAGSSIQALIGGLSPELSDNLNSLEGMVMGALSDAISSVSGNGVEAVTRGIGAIPGFLVAMIFTVMLSFFISIQYDSVIGFIKSLFPEKVSSKTGEFISLLKGTVFEYSKAVLKLMGITFIELTIGFFILGVPNAIGVAAGIAIFDALPVFGTGGVMIPWIVFELLQQNFTLAGGLAILYVIVTAIRNIIEPKIVGDQLELNPILSLVSIYAGFRLFGVIGMILFPILTSIVLTLYRNGFFGTWPKAWKEALVPERGFIRRTASSVAKEAEGEEANAEEEGAASDVEGLATKAEAQSSTVDERSPQAEERAPDEKGVL